MSKQKKHRSAAEIIRHYLTTGDDVSQSEMAYQLPSPHPTKKELQTALSDEVRRREHTRPPAILPPGFDTIAAARGKAAPMVRGLFPTVEREAVQHVLEQSVIFLTADNIHNVIESRIWLSTAWKLASIYLDSIGAEPLGDGSPQPVGMGEETTSYVSLAYFTEEDRIGTGPAYCLLQ